MYANVRGFIQLDERHIIIHNKPPEYWFPKETITAIIKKGFRQRFRNQSNGIIMSLHRSCDDLPTWFAAIVAEEDTHNDWHLYPYVALQSAGGIISSSPFTSL